MSDFVTNPTEFSAECARESGRCTVDRKNILFLDDGEESGAIAHLRMKCGYVIVIPDASNKDRALLYLTSCQRMTDVVSQIFEGSLEALTSLPQRPTEMTLGELHRRCITMPYDECKARVEHFSF